MHYKFLAVLLLAVLANMAVAHAATTNVTYEINITVFGLPVAIDLDNLNISHDFGNSSTDVDIYQSGSAILVSPVNGATYARVDDMNFGTSYDCSKVQFSNFTFTNMIDNQTVLCINTTEGKYGLIRSDFPSVNSDLLYNLTLIYEDNGSKIFNNTVVRNINLSYVYVPPILTAGSGGIGFFDLESGIVYQQYAPSSANYEIILSGAGNQPVNGARAATMLPNSSYVSSPSQCTLIPDSSYNNLLFSGWDTPPVVCIKTATGSFIAFQRTGFLAPFGINATAAGRSDPVLPGVFVSGSASGLNVTDVYLDFETQSFSSSFFPGADLHLDILGGTLSVIPNDTFQFYGQNTNQLNDLDTVSCASLLAYLNSTQVFSQLDFPPGQYDTYCFNLSSEHNNTPGFFGAVKLRVIQPVNPPSFIMYFAYYTPGFNVFTVTQFSPQTPVVGQNATMIYTTSIPMTTNIRVRSYDATTNTYSPFVYINDNGAFNTTHAVTIPAAAMPIPALYEVWFSGNDASNNTYASTSAGFTFTVFSNTTIPPSTDITGFGVFTFNEFGFPDPSFISLDGSPAAYTQAYNNSQGILVFGTDFKSAALGVHIISAIDYQGSRMANATVNMTKIPFYDRLNLQPFGCIPYTYNPNLLACQDSQNVTQSLRESRNSTGSYCAFTPDVCNIYNLTTGQCVTTAGQRTPPESYVLYSCYGGAFPSNINLNGTASGATVPVFGNGTDVVTPLANPLAQALGTTVQGILAMIALIITSIVGIYAGAKTRLAEVSLGAMILMIFIFTFGLPWLPVWIILLFAVICAFMAGRMARGFFTGGGGHA
jgi:hypothetical protein